jgi:hypothetical protein
VYAVAGICIRVFGLELARYGFELRLGFFDPASIDEAAHHQ